MLEVKHLVIHDVLDRETGNPGMVEDAAHHDGIVRRIVVAQAIAGMVAAPRHLGAGHEAMKEPLVELFK